jgi:hypothetical protein
MNAVMRGDSVPPPGQSRGIRLEKTFGGPFLVPAIQAALSALIMLLVSNWHCIYQQDQMAKVAQIISMSAHSDWRHFATATDYYSKDLFSAYYLAATAFYKLTGLPALEALNLLSVLCGVIFFTVTPAFLRRAFNLPPWLSWVALVSAPILVLTFSYGNETAFAIAMTSLAALALTFDSRTAVAVGAIFYVVAAYSRSDYLLLWPALSFLTLVRKGEGVDWRRSIQNVLFFAAVSAALGVGYLVLVLRKWPQPETLVYQPTLKLFVAYFAYAPNLVSAMFAVVGFGMCLATRRLRPLLLLAVFLQCLPYLTCLTSPKYVLPSVVVIVIFAVMGMLPLLKCAPLLLAVLLAVPWVFSLSPYGVFGPVRSAFWYVPTDHGPLPAGGFVGFYAQVKQGFYQQRYSQELDQIGEVMPLLESSVAGADIVGYFNVQTIRLWSAWHGRWDIPADKMSFWVNDLGDAGDQRGKFMIKMSYLYGFKQSSKLRAQLVSACNAGQVRAAAGRPGDPFPDAIKCGPQVPEGTDPELGRRILFLNSYYRGNQVMRQDVYVKDFSAVSWMPRDQFDKLGFQSIKPLYSDSHWVCLGEDIPRAVYYSMRFPLAYNTDRQQMK